MRRRALLACSLSVAIVGCTGDTPLGGDGTSDEGDGPDAGGDDSGGEGNGTEGDGDDGAETRYTVGVGAPKPDPGDGAVCEFESLPDAAQEEFETAIEGVDFETADYGYYSSENSPALLDTDCYNVYVEYEGEYYRVSVDAAGG